MKQKYEYLSKNIFLFTISKFVPKILVFLLVPLYTSTLTTAEYGIGDIISATASLLLPILTLSISESVLRFCFDDNFTYQEVFSNTILVFIQGFFVLCILLCIVFCLPCFDIKGSYLIALGLIFFSHGLFSIITSFARGTDNIRIMVEMSIVSIVSTCGINIVLLLVLNFGLDGFLIANYLGVLLSCFYGSFRLKIWNFLTLNGLQKGKRKELIKFSVPLIFNKISWWLNNTASRYVVTWILGVAANGVYTVAYKIPTILTNCTGIFAQAWQISAIKEFDKNDSDRFIITLYNLYNAFLVLCCSVLILFDIPLAKFLYAKDFFEAWKFVPPLLISFVFGGLTGFFGSIFIAVKDTKIFTTSTIIGGIVNIVLTFFLTSIMHDATGAAIATLVSNIVIWVIRAYVLRVYIILDIPYVRHSYMYVLLIFQYQLCLQGLDITYVCIQLLVFAMLMYINRKEVIVMISKVIAMVRSKAKK